jgi:hypothetical protein
MAVRGGAGRMQDTGGQRTAAAGAEKTTKLMVQYLLKNDAFIDSLDKLCRYHPSDCCRLYK